MDDFKVEASRVVFGKLCADMQLSVEKYCSVRSSLDRDIPVEWEVELH